MQKPENSHRRTTLDDDVLDEIFKRLHASAYIGLAIAVSMIAIALSLLALFGKWK